MIYTIHHKKYGDQQLQFDDEDFEFLYMNNYKINVEYNKSKKGYYAYTLIEGKKIRLHRLITKCPKNLVVDHIDGDGLNNKKENLRICTQKENLENHRDSLLFSPKGTNKLKIRGLFMVYDKRDNRYYYRFKLKNYKTKCFCLKRYKEAVEYAANPELMEGTNIEDI